MRRELVLYVLTVPLFVAIDFVWLGVISGDLYRSRLGGLMADTFVWWAAVLFYLLFCLGLLAFAVLPALRARSLARAAQLGAGFGFFGYMTYSLTNLATLRDWPADLAVVDIAWGTFLGGTVSTLAYAVGSLLTPD